MISRPNTLPLLLHLAKLPRSTFYDHRNRLTQPDRHAQIEEAIRLVFAQARGVDRSPASP